MAGNSDFPHVIAIKVSFICLLRLKYESAKKISQVNKRGNKEKEGCGTLGSTKLGEPKAPVIGTLKVCSQGGGAILNLGLVLAYKHGESKISKFEVT